MACSLDTLLNILPQTQCTRCGFSGCKPYAEALLTGTPHNQCPPGRQKTADRLAAALERPSLALNPDFGTEGPHNVVWVDESLCIGCTKCIDACPVDAIVGAPKRMHSVIEDECTGCELCIEPCPVDCIHIKPAPENRQDSHLTTVEQAERAKQNRLRYEKKLHRQNQQKTREASHYTAVKWAGADDPQESLKAKLDYIAAAKARKKGPKA